MKNSFRFIFISILILSAGFLFINREWVYYGIIQLKGQLHLLQHVESLEDYVNRIQDDSLSTKVQLIEEVVHFAEHTLGLADTDNYQTIYDQKGKPLMWVVTGVKPFKMEAYEWNIPIAGKFNYLGYFDSLKAYQLEEKLQNMGFETRVRNASAWSTLGWLQDPLLSDILNRDAGYLAELIIHELTHATIFVKDSVNFNENLASFIGEEGAKMFLKKSKRWHELEDYQEKLHDQKLFQLHMVKGYQSLDSLFGTFGMQEDSLSKALKKKKMIAGIIHSMDTLTFFDTTRYHSTRFEKTPNNAYFYAFRRYFGDMESIENEFRHDFGSDLVAYIAKMKMRYKK